MMEWTIALTTTFLWANTRWALLNRLQKLARSVKVPPGD
jgi:hypothetical protein